MEEEQREAEGKLKKVRKRENKWREENGGVEKKKRGT